MVGTFTALDGEQPRFLNIWVYESVDERAQIRADAVKQGVWPPKGEPRQPHQDDLDALRSAAALAADVILAPAVGHQRQRGPTGPVFPNSSRSHLAHRRRRWRQGRRKGLFNHRAQLAIGDFSAPHEVR